MHFLNPRLTLLPSPTVEMASLGLRQLMFESGFAVHLAVSAVANLFLLLIDRLDGHTEVTWSWVPMAILGMVLLLHGMLVFGLGRRMYGGAHHRLETELLQDADSSADRASAVGELRSRLFESVEQARDTLRTISPELAADVARGQSHALGIVSWLDEAERLQERAKDHNQARREVAQALSRPESRATRPVLERLLAQLDGRDLKLASLSQEMERRRSLLESFFLVIDSANMAKATDGVLTAVSRSIRERVDRLEQTVAPTSGTDTAQPAVEAQRIRQEVGLAQELQKSLLPRAAPETPGLRVAHLYQPSSEVGGDFFDFYEVGPSRLLIAVGDASGHGLDSSMVSSMAKSALYSQVSSSRTLEETMTEMNRMMCDTLGSRRLMTFVLVEIDTDLRQLSWVNAGQVFPFLRRGSTLRELEQPGYPLGVRSDTVYRQLRIDLEPGDVLLMLTDGYVEALSPEGEHYGWQRLTERFLEHEETSPRELVAALTADLSEHLENASAQDDVTLVAVHFDP